MIRFFNEDVALEHTILTSVAPWLTDVAATENRQLTSLVYIFCSDAHLLSVNQQFLQHDYYTDVITFDYREEEEQPLEGDIFISIDRVTENATIHSDSFITELLRVMVHGLLHLIGHDDKTSESMQSMRRLEDKYLHLYSAVYSQP